MGPVALVGVEWARGRQSAIRGRLRRQLGQDLDLRDRLPEDSAARRGLDQHIESQVAELVASLRHDPSGMFLATVFLLVLLAAGVAAYIGVRTPPSHGSCRRS